MHERESVFFYTLHKCASTLFSDYVLKNLGGLRYVDYASKLYNGEIVEKVTFERRGHVYGPIRVSANPLDPEYVRLVRPAAQVEFVRDRIAIFLVRDPRDVLVSSYYSFGYTHGFSPVGALQALQRKGRDDIQRRTIDAYVIESAKRKLSHYQAIDSLAQVCIRGTVLTYEDMIVNWAKFARSLTKFVDIEQTVLDQIYARSRPRATEDETSHRRSGRVGGFRSKLRVSTVEELNRIFAPVLTRYNYLP